MPTSRLAAAVLVVGVGAIPGVVNRAGILEKEVETDRRLDDDAPNPYTCPDGVKSAKEDWRVRHDYPPVAAACAFRAARRHATSLV